MDIRFGRSRAGSFGAEVPQSAFVDQPDMGLRAVADTAAERLIF